MDTNKHDLYSAIYEGRMKTLMIVGRGKSVKDWEDRADADVWAMNDFAYHGLAVARKRVPDAAFEMHADALDSERYDDAYKMWLRDHHVFPIYMPTVDTRIPASVAFPINMVSALYCNHLWIGERDIERFYTSTTCYMLALALFKNYRRIELYGIDLVSAPEYRSHRDAVFFWLGKATGMGVDVVTSESCPLFAVAEYPPKNALNKKCGDGQVEGGNLNNRRAVSIRDDGGSVKGTAQNREILQSVSVR